MTASVTLSLDAMGGDVGPDVVVPAGVLALEADPGLRLVFVGDERKLAPHVQGITSAFRDRVRIQHASQQVTMDESPSRALRMKKDSSMRVAMDLVKSDEAQACVSAGNTGALMATARFVLKMIPGIARPAIITALPTMQGHTHVLDLGANVDCEAEHLFQFGVMAAEVVRAVDGVDSPRIALLNIGEEAIKGNDQVKTAARLLSESALNYVGYVEGDGIYKGGVDIIVCDGFVGNVALKASEGVATMVAYYLRRSFTSSVMAKVAGLLALPVLKGFRKRIDPRRYNGASLVGLQGIVVKSHGGADALAFANAIKIAKVEVEKDVPNQIGQQVETLLEQRQVV
jgi:glycerol-3-phosphate acyltransferase PlsX